jgi:hypothetical protein
MSEIADLFRCKLYISNKHNIIKITVSDIDKLKLINSYLNKYPLMTSKHLNYISYLEGFNYINRHLLDNEISEIRTVKSSMNRTRTYFNWDHLNNFYGPTKHASRAC